ncbi:MAG: SGNH/GDSL hydrolase family protein [Myxococcota bacterium]
MNRRTILKLGAVAVAAAAIGGGAYARRSRLRSETITGEWPEAGQGVFWLLPGLTDARMVVPDRPHTPDEARDAAARARIGRVRTFFVNTSDKRLRGADFAEKPAVTRLLAIGDSVTFGWGVADDESWPAKLAAELARRGRQVEVLNAGVPAQRIEAMVSFLGKIAPRWSPHGVIFTRRPYPQTPDPVQHYAEAIGQAQRALPQARIMVVMPPVSRFDPRGCRGYRAESEGVRARLGGTPVVELTDVFRAAQGQRGASLVEEGGRVRVVRLETGEALVDAAADGRGLPREVYDLFERDASVREALFFDDGHPDADGMDVFARAVADAVEERRWLG